MPEGGVLVSFLPDDARLLYKGYSLIALHGEPCCRTLWVVLVHQLLLLYDCQWCPPLGKLLLLYFALARVRAKITSVFVDTRHILLFCIVRKLFRFCLSIGCTWLRRRLKSYKQSACLVLPPIRTPYIWGSVGNHVYGYTLDCCIVLSFFFQ